MLLTFKILKIYELALCKRYDQTKLIFGNIYLDYKLTYVYLTILDKKFFKILFKFKTIGINYEKFTQINKNQLRYILLI